MSEVFRAKNFVLYKNAPAVVEHVDAKISIQLVSGKKVSVRPKDIQWLHAGPLGAFEELDVVADVDLEGTWELLLGESVELSELAELMCGECTPASVWRAWGVLDEEVWFTGSIDAVVARPKADVDAILNKRREKEAEAVRWLDYLQRVKGNDFLPEDLGHLSDVQRLAYRKASMNRTLKALGIEVVPERAHRMLLQMGLWDDTVNPYPARFDCATSQPVMEVPALPVEQRRDLTELDAFAIDDDNCSDPDDAISLDGDALWVHIADVAALVPPDSPIDVEARARGANLYLPEAVIHMLPQGVTEALGLGLQERSPALSFRVELDESGEAMCSEITPSWVRVERVSYSVVDQRLDVSPFKEIRAITEKFRTHRFEQGASDIILPEVKVKTSVVGELYNFSVSHELGLKTPAEYSVKITDLPRLMSREMVTDAMLMTGEAVAKFLVEHAISAPFASQSPPDEVSNPETLAEMFAYRKKFKRSTLHLEPELHAGLGLERYTRVTSPLRRYSDLLVHQQLRAYLAGVPLIGEADMLKRMAEAELGGGNTSMAERRSNRHWTLLYMKQNPDVVYRGVLVDKRDDRGTVLIPELAIDVKLRRVADVALNSEILVQLTRVNLPDLEFSCREVKGE